MKNHRLYGVALATARKADRRANMLATVAAHTGLFVAIVCGFAVVGFMAWAIASSIHLAPIATVLAN